MHPKFLAATAKIKKEEHLFHQRLFGYLHIALESDMLSGKAARKLVVPKEIAGDGAEDPEHAPLRRPLLEDKALRQQCQNALVFAVVVFSDEDNLMRRNSIVRIAEPWQEWFNHQSKELRSAKASWPWELRQIK